ncbi:MAG: DUF4176 domain-containing protein [Coriobacteriia bacterium]|nr:DUF4176 domain-containing protein [Coriobacteriia bacterium]
MKVIADQLLPIGSVVLLNEGEKRLMIFGVDQVNPETEESYDYSGVLYPEGNLGTGSTFLFDHDDIQVIHFVGYNDIERQDFVAELKGVVDELKAKESEGTSQEEKSDDSKSTD